MQTRPFDLYLTIDLGLRGGANHEPTAFCGTDCARSPCQGHTQAAYGGWAASIRSQRPYPLARRNLRLRGTPQPTRRPRVLVANGWRRRKPVLLMVEHHRIGQLADIEPLHVAAYIEALGEDFEKPTVQQHLAAIRMLFDWMVTGQVVATNPAHAVRGPKHVVKTGKTTVLDADQARTLLAHGPCRLSHARYASRL
jgi:hypothetical protein